MQLNLDFIIQLVLDGGYGDIKQAINSFITNTNKSEVQGDQDDEESDLYLATYL